MSRGYLVFATSVLLLWGAAVVRGYEPFSGRRGVIPQSVRQSPGGYRSYNYWGGGK
jgi:hypothetical protein